MQQGTFIDEAYQATEADLLYSVKINDEMAYLYVLCEHQSEIDKNMAFRLLVYVIRAMELHRKTHPDNPLPIVYPLARIFHHGASEKVQRPRDDKARTKNASGAY